MSFTLIPVDDVLNYISKYSTESKNAERRMRMSEIIDKIKKGRWIAFHGFMNEYEEKYIILGKDMNTWYWAGDESDWEISTSHDEDIFVKGVLAADRLRMEEKKNK